MIALSNVKFEDGFWWWTYLCIAVATLIILLSLLFVYLASRSPGSVSGLMLIFPIAFLVVVFVYWISVSVAFTFVLETNLYLKYLYAGIILLIPIGMTYRVLNI